nr:hypothetical protein [uncultured Carboxylicivirga sp.]
MRYLIFVLFITMCLSTYSQDFKLYNYNIEKAEYYKSQNFIDSSLIYLNKAYECANKFICFDNILASDIYHQVGDTAMIEKCLQTLFDNGFNKEFIDDLGIGSYHLNSKTNLYEQYQGLEEILEMFGVDQFVRQPLQETSMAHQMSLADSINYVKLRALIEEYGFPGFNNVGFHTNKVLALIMHITTNNSTKYAWDNYFKELLLAEAAKGNIKYSDYAFIADRYTYASEGWQTYGLLIMLTSSGKEFIPFKDINGADSCRATIGMAPLFFRAKTINAELPKGY